MKARLLTIFAIAGTLVFIGSPHGAHAISIVPPTLDYTAQPGQTLTGQVKVLNNEKSYQTYYLSTASFTAGGETGEPKFNFKTDISDLALWIKTDTQRVDLQPDNKAVINFTIAVPKDATPGGHYAGIFFSTAPPDSGNVKVQQATGTLVILRVEGQIHETASVATFVSKGSASFSHLPVTFDLRIQNTGNVHIRPQGTILIKNLFGGESETLSLNDANGAILPNSIRMFDATWKKGSDNATQTGFLNQVKNEWYNFAIGPYTATATMTYGTSKQTLVATTKVTIIPWQLLLVELVILIIVIVIVVLGMSQYNKAIIRKAQQTLPPKKG